MNGFTIKYMSAHLTTSCTFLQIETELANVNCKKGKNENSFFMTFPAVKTFCSILILDCDIL